MSERQSSKSADRLRMQVARTDARQRMLGQRLERAFDEYRLARSEYEDAVTDYIAALEERVDAV
ncbi:MAG: hypothetical protein D3M94_19835 [Rhodocyclales bacterium GT-UBC]|nr:MAG: hypothetical protein D3M94_19835 [Rhodocyclales bacterium GT-UBC]